MGQHKSYSFTPLTINDIDVTELTLYDSLGNTTILEVDTVGPSYPIAVVGMNESMAMEVNYDGTTSLGKVTSGTQVKITKIKLKRSAWAYEPWWQGKAEVYFVQHVPEEQNKIESVISNWAFCYNNFSGSINDSISTFQGVKVSLQWLHCSLKASPEEWWNVSLGERTNYKKYQVWKWKRWRGYKQDKPWRTMNYNTGWDPSSYDYTKRYQLRVIEYDFPFYDRGADEWCYLVGLGVGTYVNPLLGIAAWLTCEVLVINDDLIGSKMDFENQVYTAKEHPGSEYTWINSAWEIKVKVQ